MGNVLSKNEESMIMETQLTKRLGASTKRLGSTTKGPTEVMMEEYSKSGGYGDYTVTKTDGQQVPISSAITIRVLDHGELNLVTDTGCWYLFAPNAWLTAFPTQPNPGDSDGN